MSQSRLFKPSVKAARPDLDLFLAAIQVIIQHQLDQPADESFVFKHTKDFYDFLLSCKSLSLLLHMPSTRLLMVRFLSRDKLSLFKYQMHERLNKRLRNRFALRLVEDSKFIPVSLALTCALLLLSTFMLLAGLSAEVIDQRQSLSRYHHFNETMTGFSVLSKPLAVLAVMFCAGYLLNYLSKNLLHDFGAEHLQQIDLFVTELRTKIENAELSHQEGISHLVYQGRV